MTDSLRGVREGTYVQQQVGMVTFLATVIRSGGALKRNVTESCPAPDCLMSTHNASIARHRCGSAVSFIKRNGPPGRGYNTASHESTVSAGTTKIDGH